jgi:hypothetical protein
VKRRRMSTKPTGLSIFWAAVLVVGLAGCAGSPSPDGGAPHSFSELRIGRPRQEAEIAPAQVAPEQVPVAPAVTPPPVRQAATMDGASRHHDAVARTPAPVSAARKAVAATSVTTVIPMTDPAVAARRVNAYLTAQGFSAEDSDQGEVRIVTATRMAEPRKLVGEAACSLEAMRRPDFSATNLTIRLTPGAAGLEVGVQSSFVEVNTNLVSGSLVRETCRSRGVIEAGVRQAAQGG